MEYMGSVWLFEKNWYGCIKNVEGMCKGSFCEKSWRKIVWGSIG